MPRMRRCIGKRRLALLEQQGPEQGDYPASVVTTWLLNFEAVRGASGASARVLELSGFLAADGIPYELLVLGRVQLGEEIGLALVDVADDPVLLEELLEPLGRYSLIRVEPAQRAYSLHRMVQAVVRDGLDAAARGAWVERLVAALGQAFPRFDSTLTDQQYLEYVGRWGRLLAHGKELALWEPAESEAWASLLHNMSFFLNMQGAYGEAIAYQERSLAIREAQLGADHPDTAQSLNNLAALYESMGRYGDAEPLYLRTIQIFLAALGQDHPNTQTFISNFVYLLQQVITAGRTAELSDHPITQGILASLKSAG